MASSSRNRTILSIIAASIVAVPVSAEDLTAEGLFEEGRKAFSKGRFGRAESLFAQLIGEYGENPDVAEAIKVVRPLLVLAYLRQEKFEEAGPLLAEVLEEKTADAKVIEKLQFWKGLTAFKLGDYGGAKKTLGEFYAGSKNDVSHRAEALLLVGTADILQGNFQKAADFFRDQIPRLRNASPEVAGRAVVLRFHALVQAGEKDQALDFLKEAFPSIEEITQLVSFQLLVLQLGSAFLEEGDYYAAIACLQRVWTRERLLRHQGERLKKMGERIAALEARKGRQGIVSQYRGVERRVRRELETLEKTAGFDTALRLRLVAAFQGLGRFRESALLLEDLLTNTVPTAVNEPAGVVLLQCWSQLGRWSRVVRAANLYEKRFLGPGLAKGLPTVLFLRAQALGELDRTGEEVATYARIVAEHPDSAPAAEAYFLEAIALLKLDDTTRASEQFRTFRKRYAGHQLVEASRYWEGMALSFGQKYAAARERLAAYLKDYPQGNYATGAEFRRAFCLQAQAYYEKSAQEMRRFISGHPSSAYVGEAKLLLGDALMATGEIDAGIGVYRSIDPGDRHFYEDAWFKIGRVYWLREELSSMREHFDEFVRRFPDSNRVAEAVYQSGRASVNEGAPEAAREVYWKAVRELGDGKENLAVEDILLALPRFYKGSEQRELLLHELDALGKEAAEDGRRTLSVRCLWAKAHAAEGAEDKRTAFLEAAENANARNHGARVVVDCAEERRLFGVPLVSERLFRDARRWHPRSTEKDRIYAGLGFIARDAGRYDEAVRYFERAERATFRPRLRGEILLEKAALQTPGLAGETLTGMLKDPSLPGEVKARGLMRFAEIEKSGDSPERALVYYERVYIGYGKYRDLVAQAYYDRGALLEELGKPAEALEVYRELVGREELVEFEPHGLALTRIGKLGG